MYYSIVAFVQNANVKNISTNEYVRWLFVWLLWLFTGMIFYCNDLDVGYSRGFYMAVNVGYSIGWGDIAEINELSSQWFSVFFILVGATFVGAALGYFGTSLMADSANWYERGVAQKTLDEQLQNSGYWFKIYAHITMNSEYRLIVLFFLFWICGTAFACALNDWPFITGVYFSLSSMSTGGLISLPSGTPNWQYGMLGIYSAFGVPLMGIAMAGLTKIIMERSSNIDNRVEAIKEPVTERELKMMETFGLANDDGIIDRTEFVLLCMVRIGAVDPDLIQFIMDYFDELDEDKSGTLSIEEIVGSPKSTETFGDIVKKAVVRRSTAKLQLEQGQGEGDSALNPTISAHRKQSLAKANERGKTGAGAGVGVNTNTNTNTDFDADADPYSNGGNSGKAKSTNRVGFVDVLEDDSDMMVLNKVVCEDGGGDMELTDSSV